MRNPTPGPMGGEGKAVQADETYFGTKDEYRGKSWSEKKGHTKKMSVVSLVSEGQARTFHVDRANAETIRSVLFANVTRRPPCTPTKPICIARSCKVLLVMRLCIMTLANMSARPRDSPTTLKTTSPFSSAA